MALREKDLYLNMASLGKYLKSSKDYPELSEKESWTPMSKFPLPSVSPEHHLQTPLFQSTNWEQWNLKNWMTSAPDVCISEAALIYLKLSFESEEKQLVQGVSPTESNIHIYHWASSWDNQSTGAPEDKQPIAFAFATVTWQKSPISLKVKNSILCN